MARLLVLIAAALLPLMGLLAPLGAQDGDASAPAAAPTLRVQIVLPDHDVAPPTAQVEMLQWQVKRLITDSSAAIQAKLAPGGRLLTVTAHANPFADRGMPTMDAHALELLTANVLWLWTKQLDQIAAADASQRTAEHRASVSVKLAETKQQSLALAARIEALNAQGTAAGTDAEKQMLMQSITEAQRELIAVRGRLAELQAHLDFECPVRPIRPVIVRDIGAGTAIDDAVQRLRAGD